MKLLNKLLPELKTGGNSPLENKLDYVGFVESPGHGACGWLTAKGGHATRNLNQMWLVLPLVMTGIDPNQTKARSAVSLDAQAHLLAQLPHGYKLRFDTSVTAAAARTHRGPVSLNEGGGVAGYLVADAMRHDRRLMHAGYTNQVTLNAYLHVPLLDIARLGNGKLEHALATVKQWTSKTFIAADDSTLEQCLRYAFAGAAQFLNQCQAAGLHGQFMGPEAVLKDISERVGGVPLKAPPQRLLLTETGLIEEIHDHPSDSRSPLFHILKGVAIEPHPDHVVITSQHHAPRYLAVMRLESLPKLLPGPQDLISFLPDLLALSQLTGVRYQVEYSPFNTDVVDVVAQKQVHQNKVALAEAEAADVINAKAADNLAQSADLLHATANNGGRCVQIGAVLIVERASLKALHRACTRLEHVLGVTFMLVREQHRAPDLWLQTLPLKQATLMRFSGADLRLRHLVKDAMALLPVATPQQGDRDGVLYHTQDFNQPYWLDFAHENRQFLLVGSTRSGKTNTLVNIAATSLLQGKSVIILDFVRPGGAATFDRFCALMGGVYIDPVTVGLDILALPSVVHIQDPVVQRARLEASKAAIKGMLRFHLLGRPPTHLTRQDRLDQQTLDILIDAYWAHTDAEAQALAGDRAGATALSAGFFDFCHIDNLKDYDLGPEAELAIARIRAAYIAESQSAFGQVLFRPATLDTAAKLQCFPIKEGEGDEAAKAAMVAAYVAQRQAFAAEEDALVLCDEGSVILRDPVVAHTVGRFYALGLGMGIHVGIATQDIEVVISSPVAAQILANCNTLLIGRTQEPALRAFLKDLQIPLDLIRPTLAYQVNTKTLSSEWLIVDSLSGQRRYVPCRFFCSPALLAITASNPDQNRARRRLMTAFPEDPVAGLTVFAEKLAHAIQSDQSIEMLVEAYLAEHCV